MFHSFKTQQDIYRSDNAVQRAIDTLQSTTRGLPDLSSVQDEFSEDSGGFEEMDDEEDEFDEFPDELFHELADSVRQQQI
jgi:hypothetical protein